MRNRICSLEYINTQLDLSDLRDVEKPIEDNDILQYNLSTETWETTRQVEGIEHVLYDTTYTPANPNIEGLTWWNPDEKTLNISTGLGPVNQPPYEDWFLVWNSTGSQIDNGTAVHPIGSATNEIPNVVKSISETYLGFTRAVWVATMDIPDGEIGIATVRGKVNDIYTGNTDNDGLGNGVTFSAGDNLWLSPYVAGEFVNSKPAFPNYVIQIGGVSKASSGVGVKDGNIIVSAQGEETDTVQNFWNGVFRESFDFRVTVEDQGGGDKIWGKLRPSNGHPDMTMMFSDGFTLLPTDVGEAEIELTPSVDDTVPVTNFVYIPQSSKVLTTATAWPEDIEHIKVAEVVVQSIATTKLNGALRNQNWNDHIQDTGTDQGHLSHIGRRIRILDAQWETGTEATVSGVSGTQIDVTSGEVNQMHLQTFPAISMTTGDDIHIPNDPDTPYRTLTDLDILTKAADGVAFANAKYHSLVIWGVCNKTGESSHIFCNLPSDSSGYNSAEGGISDAFGYADYSIPRQYRGVGFLIARFVFKYTGGAWSWTAPLDSYYQDLRGFIPNSTAGSGAGGSGITTFLGLTDTPSAYTGFNNYIPQVVGESSLQFTDDLSIATIDLSSTLDVTGISTLTGGLRTDNIGPASFIDDTLIQLSTGQVDISGNVIGTELISFYDTSTTNQRFGPSNLGSITSGTDNTAVGYNNLVNATSGFRNTAVGCGVLEDLTTGSGNVGLGCLALRNLTIGTNNMAIGFFSMQGLTEGGENVGIGTSTLQSSSFTGSDNIAIGTFAGSSMTSGGQNVAIGSQALESATSDFFNVAIGYRAGEDMTGNEGTFIGHQAGTNVTSGNSGVYIGYRAGFNQTTLSDRLIIDNVNRASAAAEITDSLMYGIFSPSGAASQSLRINGELLSSYGAKLGDGGTTNYLEVSSTGTVRPRGSATYQSNDGSPGLTGTFNFNGVSSGQILTMTFKDGLLTATTTVP